MAVNSVIEEKSFHLYIVLGIYDKYTIKYKIRIEKLDTFKK